METAALYSFIIANGYLFLLLALIIEGPIVTYLGGMAASFGYLNFTWVIVLAIIGSITADTFFFLIGRFEQKRVHDWVHKKQQRTEALEDINEQITHRPIRTLLYIKLMPYLSVPGFMIAGTTNISFLRFVLYGTGVGAVYITTFGILGWLSAIPLQAIDNAFGWIQLALFVIGVAGAGYWFYRKRYARTHPQN